jgi:hypothetical protein
MRSFRLAAAVACLGAALVAIVAACTQNTSDAPIPVQAPDRASFPAVADLLDHRCGTLDCHGMVGRNLRIYGREGLRKSANDHPTSHPDASTQDEYDETYLSLVGLEPEIMSAVVDGGGASPERLTFVRKARGAERHKGGQLVTEGDEEDRCIVSWLAGKTDDATCRAALDAAF